MRKAIIGAMGILTVIILLCITSCQPTDSATQELDAKIIHLRPGRKLVSCDWNSYNRDVWYITRPMEAGEKATEYEYGNERGTVYIIQEEDRKDMSGHGGMSIDMDMDAIRQMRMHE